MLDRPSDAPAPALFQSERQDEIAFLTIQRGRVEVAELARRFGVTTETIRRDLSELQERNVVRRVHGGAIPFESVDFEPDVAVRGLQHDPEKRRLAGRAVQELPPGGDIIIDSGSTLTRFAEAIPRGTELQVVTNSLPTAQALAQHDSIDVIVIGGALRKSTLAMVDSDAIAAVRPLRVDTLFISADGFSPEHGLTTPYREEAALKRAMIAAARRVVAIVDHSKLRHDRFITFAEWSEVDTLVTNREGDEEAAAAIASFGTAVLLA